MSDEKKNIEEVVNDLQSPDTFDFMSVLNGDTRGYPKDEVSICLDEATAYTIMKLESKAAGMDSGEEYDAVISEIKALLPKLGEATYVFKLTGVPQEVKEDMLKLVQEKFPAKYDTNKNFLTGGIDRVEKANPERDRYFTALVHQVHVEQIIAPDKRVDTAPSVETIDAFILKAPESQVEKFAKAIQRLQVTAAAFEQATNEDFLVKS